MKNILIIAITLLWGINLFSQTPQNDENNQFRRDYKFISLGNLDTNKWSELKESNNTFVFNVDSNKDIKVFWANGEKEIFRKVSEIRDGKTDDDIKYQFMTVLDEKGNEIFLFLYEDNSLLLVIGENDAYMFSQ
jgi:hypothetical protein